MKPHRRDIFSLLTYEANRDPHLANLVATIATLSADEIRQAKVKMPWMRQALLQLKVQSDREELERTAAQWARHGVTPDPIGEMRRWVCQDTFVKLGQGKQLELRHGQLIWLRDGVWFDSIFTTTIDPILYQASMVCGQVTRSAYMAAVRERVSKMMPVNDVKPSEPYRIYRI